MCDTPAGARPSGSNSRSAKLLVPSGTPDHASGGERFSPTQFGDRCLSLQAFLAASVPLSWICGEDSVSGSALAVPIDRANAPARNRLPRAYFIAFPPVVFLVRGHPTRS